jgi:hypothetical protein
MNSDETLILSMTIVAIFIIFFVPIIWVLVSSRSHGGAKFGWFIVVLFFSWLGLAVFLIITQSSKIDKPRIGSSSSGSRVEPNISESEL